MYVLKTKNRRKGDAVMITTSIIGLSCLHSISGYVILVSVNHNGNRKS